MIELKEIQETIDKIHNLIQQLSNQYEKLNKTCQNKEELTSIIQKIKKLETNLSIICPDQKRPITASMNGTLDKLKKRAERFGCVSSSEIKKVMDNEALLKRKQKFDKITLDKDNKNKSKINLNNLDTDQAKKKRLERFAAHM